MHTHTHTRTRPNPRGFTCQYADIKASAFKETQPHFILRSAALLTPTLGKCLDCDMTEEMGCTLSHGARRVRPSDQVGKGGGGAAAISASSRTSETLEIRINFVLCIREVISGEHFCFHEQLQSNRKTVMCRQLRIWFNQLATCWMTSRYRNRKKNAHDWWIWLKCIKEKHRKKQQQQKSLKSIKNTANFPQITGCGSNNIVYFNMVLIFLVFCSRFATSVCAFCVSVSVSACKTCQAFMLSHFSDPFLLSLQSFSVCHWSSAVWVCARELGARTHAPTGHYSSHLICLCASVSIPSVFVNYL